MLGHWCAWTFKAKVNTSIVIGASNFSFLGTVIPTIRKEGLGSLERKYLWEDISHLSKSENIQEWLIKWVPVSIYTATEELKPKTEN